MLLSDDELNAMQVEIDDWKARTVVMKTTGSFKAYMGNCTHANLTFSIRPMSRFMK